jgi:hypothetical protein
LAGITFTIDANNNLKHNGSRNLTDANTMYHVGTNDYLANGGDNMNFSKRIQSLI